jgi:hypothetical protein
MMLFIYIVGMGTLVVALLNLPDRVLTIPAALAVPAGAAGPAAATNLAGM